MNYGTKEWNDAVKLLANETRHPIYVCENALYITLGNFEFAINYLKSEKLENTPSRY